MQASLPAASRVRSALAVSQKVVLKPSINGWRCCATSCSKITSGLTQFWPAWNSGKKERNDEQVDADDRRRHARGCDKALRGSAAGRVSGPHRTGTDPEMVAWP